MKKFDASILFTRDEILSNRDKFFDQQKCVNRMKPNNHLNASTYNNDKDSIAETNSDRDAGEDSVAVDAQGRHTCLHEPRLSYRIAGLNRPCRDGRKFFTLRVAHNRQPHNLYNLNTTKLCA